MTGVHLSVLIQQGIGLLLILLAAWVFGILLAAMQLNQIEIDADGEEDIYFSTTCAGSNWEIEIGLSQYIISIFLTFSLF